MRTCWSCYELENGDYLQPLITKLLARLESEAVNEVNYVHTQQMMSALEKYIIDLSFDLPCEVFCSKISFGGVLRSAGIEIPNDYEDDLERLLDYMELTRELDRNKLFILVNLRGFYGDAETEAFLDTVRNHEYRVLLVDSAAHPLLPAEKRVTVDSDLCEF